VIEDGAYLFVDFLYPEIPMADRWPRLTIGRTVVLDLTPAKAPILLELRQVMESWKESADLHPPETVFAGSVQILTTGRWPYPVTTATDANQRLAHIRLGLPAQTVAVKVASHVLFEVTDVTREGPETFRGHLAGVWVLDLPKPSGAAVLLRALGAVGPPIGLATPGNSQEESKSPPEGISIPEPKRPH
jgi:hypothetical protein